MQFGGDADIYMDKKWWNSDSCHVNQWDLYNSIADTYIMIFRAQFDDQGLRHLCIKHDMKYTVYSVLTVGCLQLLH